MALSPNKESPQMAFGKRTNARRLSMQQFPEAFLQARVGRVGIRQAPWRWMSQCLDVTSPSDPFFPRLDQEYSGCGFHSPNPEEAAGRLALGFPEALMDRSPGALGGESLFRLSRRVGCLGSRGRFMLESRAQHQRLEQACFANHC